MSSPLLKPLSARPGNLTEMVLDALQQAIIDKALAPGQAISEAALAESLQVSKTPVREALLRLRHIGLVEPADRGLRITTPSASTIRYAYELRAGLERTAATLAAERADEDDLGGIDEVAAESLSHARAGEAAGFRECDRTFHSRIAQAARNPLLERSVRDTLVLTRALRARDVPVSGDSVVCAEEHVAISRALRDRDGQSAGRIIYAHALHVMQMVLSALAAAEESAD